MNLYQKIAKKVPFVAVGLVGLLNFNSESLAGEIEYPAYESRASFRIKDEHNCETMRLVGGTNLYILEAIGENPQELKNSVVNINLALNLPSNIQIVTAVPFDGETGQHYKDGDYFRNNYMQEGSLNRVRNSGTAIRSVKFESGKPYIGVTTSVEDVLAKWYVRVLETTNVVYETIGFSKFVALESGGTEKPVRTRSHKIQIVPQGYNELNLTYDTNDGETPANDGRKVPEVITIGNGMPSVLWRSTGDANGPYSQVWTNSPSLSNPSGSGCYTDRAVNLTSGNAKAFYKVTPFIEAVGASKPAAR